MPAAEPAARSSKKRTRTASNSKTKGTLTATSSETKSKPKAPKKARASSKTVTDKQLPSLPNAPDSLSLQAPPLNVLPLPAPSTQQPATSSASTKELRNALTQPDLKTTAPSKTKAAKPSRGVLATAITCRSGILPQLSRPSNAARPLAGRSNPKSGRGVTSVTPSRKFTPLKQLPKSAKIHTSQSIQTPPQIATFPLIPLICTDEFPEGTEENRIAHVKSHFVNRLFVRLNGTRNPPVLAPPFPAPFSYPTQWDGRLAFPGIHPNVFSVSNIALTVAMRFWVARAHTMFQLGAAQEWSVNANGIGLLGPDMAQWPPVMSCKKIVEELYLVTTREQPEGSSINAHSREPHVYVRYIVLTETGDVIASSRQSPSDPQKAVSAQLVEECVVRPDWYSYLQNAIELESPKINGDSPTLSNLLSKVKTKDQADFPSGINKAWAEKQRQSQEALDVAKRVVLTSCMLNR